MIDQPPTWHEIAPSPSVAWCRVCGDGLWAKPDVPPEDQRCRKHVLRNPCAIEGCRRSTKGSKRWFGIALWLCSEHWRLIAPKSAERRVYHRIFRTAKRYGWTDELNARFWRVWPRLVSRARARARGDLDMREINRVMGWAE